MKVKFKKVSPNAIQPTRGSLFAAGHDLYACVGTSIYIMPHTTIKIPTGISCAIPEGYFGAIAARSGLATKEGLRPANCLGIVDADYAGEIIVALHNDSDEPRVVEPGQRVAQLVIIPYPNVELEEVEELPKTKRGAGGFGSTGK